MPTARAATIGSAAPDATPAQRLLACASELFVAQGIRAVGIDQILRESHVAKASLYSSYGSKDALVTAFLEHSDLTDRKRWAAAVAGAADPVDRILAFFDLAAAAARRRNYRGCLYLNAATEFPDTELAPVIAHRHWMRDTLAALLRDCGARRPDTLARELQVIYDGALAGSKGERSVHPITVGRRLARDLIAAATSLDRDQLR